MRVSIAPASGLLTSEFAAPVPSVPVTLEVCAAKSSVATLPKLAERRGAPQRVRAAVMVHVRPIRYVGPKAYERAAMELGHPVELLPDIGHVMGQLVQPALDGPDVVAHSRKLIPELLRKLAQGGQLFRRYAG